MIKENIINIVCEYLNIKEAHEILDTQELNQVKVTMKDFISFLDDYFSSNEDSSLDEYYYQRGLGSFYTFNDDTGEIEKWTTNEK
jgi:hypothetical protein